MGKDLKGKELGVGLNQRKDKRYQARFTKSNGQRTEKNFSKLNDAKTWLSEQKYLDSILSGGGENMTVDDWYNFWIDNFKEGIVKDNTSKNYKNRYNFNIKKEIGSMKLCEVKQIHCQKLLNNMFDCGKYSYGTIELVQTTLHAIFKSAVENNYMPKRLPDNTEYKILLEPYPTDKYFKINHTYRIKYPYSLVAAKPDPSFKPDWNIYYDAIFRKS